MNFSRLGMNATQTIIGGFGTIGFFMSVFNNQIYLTSTKQTKYHSPVTQHATQYSYITQIYYESPQDRMRYLMSCT